MNKKVREKVNRSDIYKKYPWHCDKYCPCAIVRYINKKKQYMM